MRRPIALLCLFFLFTGLFAQEKGDKSPLNEDTFSGLQMRNIGPAFMSGRIADIDIHPEDPHTWLVAVGSGGVWYTENSGTTWQPVFDNYGSYSIGCVTYDPSNPAIVWLGTGENVGGRHVGYGDGVYKSTDGGKSWKNMGLKKSEHISEIIVHPGNSDIVWVAAQGPLWNKGDERGLYKTTDGGETWKKVLGDDQWTGATDIVIDPRDPDRLYAATWQRHRNVAAYMGGGPGSGLHRSVDGGKTWEKMTNGLPGSNMGKIGLAISPLNPDVLYAAIELDRRQGGVWRSANRGGSWQKMSDAVSGGTGPHYYQELYASPHAFDRIYLADVLVRVSEDGGRSFRPVNTQYKHVDNHALAFRKDDPDFLLSGTDGGLYVSYDLADSWQFISNLPVTQFYKVAVDDSEPFYNVVGGTQDNATQYGPSRTVWSMGIDNDDWIIVIGGDGHQPATEPGNPDILYAQSQQGFLSRVDMTNGESISIQPQPGPGEDYERFNWDSPILVSPHSPTRIYHASQRVWRSDNRGDEWTAISGDLTRDQERITLPIMGKTWSYEEPWDFLAMSNYNSITSLAESPVQKDLIYAGTDDGLIQVTEDGGKNWRRIEVGSLPGVPKTAFVNDIKADLYDANTAYVALDNHKFGDFNPYLLKSTDRGKSWSSIKGNLPDRNLVWRVVQDHEKRDLLFAATEFGVYFTINGGAKWIKLSGGVPVISFRDLAIQRRENDLVAASFGRGFFVLDDYTPLRHVTEQKLNQEATIFPIRTAWWYIPRNLGNIQGHDHYRAPNPPFGAVFTYHLKEAYSTLKDDRMKKEKEREKAGETVKFPGWEQLEAERRQDAPKIWLTVRDAQGSVVRRIEGRNAAGLQRIAWDLRYPPTDAINSQRDLQGGYIGAMAPPGEYTVTLSREIDGVITVLTEAMPFKVEKMYDGALDGATAEEASAFWRETERLNKSTTAANSVLNDAMQRIDLLQGALTRMPNAPGSLEKEIHDLKQTLLEMQTELSGNRSKQMIGEKTKPTIAGRQSFASLGTFGSTYGPTPEHRRSLQIAAEEFRDFKAQLEDIVNIQLPAIEAKMRDAGAPWIEGQEIPDYK